MAKTLGIVHAAALGVIVAVAVGCRVDTRKDGNNEDVKIATPFGGMSVKTNGAVVENNVGLAVYPGALLVTKDKGKDSGAADINMSFGSFHLGVQALSYSTPDAPAKVMAFYRKDMARFGAVILCRGKHAIGSPDHTQDGLSCDRDHGTTINMDDDAAKEELKAGSKQHQHIVAIDPEGSGTRFGLIALDLPGHLGEDEKDKD